MCLGIGNIHELYVSRRITIQYNTTAHTLTVVSLDLYMLCTHPLHVHVSALQLKTAVCMEYCCGDGARPLRSAATPDVYTAAAFISQNHSTTCLLVSVTAHHHYLKASLVGA